MLPLPGVSFPDRATSPTPQVSEPGCSSSSDPAQPNWATFGAETPPGLSLFPGVDPQTGLLPFPEPGTCLSEPGRPTWLSPFPNQAPTARPTFPNPSETPESV